MFYRFLRVFFILIVFAPPIVCATDIQTLTFKPDDDCDKNIDVAFPAPFVLTKLSYSSDVAFEKAEFLYLVDLNEGETISASNLKKSVKHLFKKNKFQTIELLVSQEADGFSLHWKFTSFWTLKRLKLYGYMLGKEAYRNYYLIEPGEHFDKDKHEHSIEKIKAVLNEAGYFNKELTVDLIPDEKTKSITVHCTIKKGDQFKVHDAQISFISDEVLNPQEIDFIRMQITKNFLHNLKSVGYSKEKISQELHKVKKFLSSYGFLQCFIELSESINYKKRELDLLFTIDLHKKKESIFIGNHFFSNDQLLDVVLLFGASAWMLPASIIQEEIEALYRRHGFWDIAIDVREEEKRHIFLIKEGERAVIQDVVVHTDLLNADMLFRRCLSRLVKNRFFCEQEVDSSIEHMLDFYAKQGYLTAKIAKKEFVANQNNNSAHTLHLFVDEGAQTMIGGITIEKFPELLLQGPFKRWTQRENPIPFTVEYLQEQRAWLLDFFRKKQPGFVELSHELKRQGSDFEIIWHVQVKNTSACFGKTVLISQTTMPFQYVMRELRYRDGDEWDRAKIHQSLKAFKSLDVFENIQLYPCASELEEEKILLLKLHDDEPFEVRTRIGFGLQQLSQGYKFGGVTYKIGGTIIAKNPCNVGDKLCIDADVLRGERNFCVQYIRPWLFDRPVRTVYKGYSNRYLQPGFMGSSKSLYEVVQQGFLMGLTQTYWGISSGVNLGFEVMETSISHAQCSDVFALKVAKALNFEPQLLDRKIPYLLVEPTILVDRLDNNVQPTNGLFTVASLKGMFPLGKLNSDLFFLKFLIEQSFFIPYEPWVIALRFRLGHIFYRYFKSIMPSERFYLGGANSLRSYDTDMCPPLGIFEDCGKCQIVPQGAKTMVNINAELRFPVYKNLGAVLFQDLGLLTKNLLIDFSARGILAGTGFGLRYNTPIGPVRFDLGFKWNSHDPTCRSYAWVLTFGQAF